MKIRCFFWSNLHLHVRHRVFQLVSELRRLSTVSRSFLDRLHTELSVNNPGPWVSDVARNRGLPRLGFRHELVSLWAMLFLEFSNNLSCLNHFLKLPDIKGEVWYNPIVAVADLNSLHVDLVFVTRQLKLLESLSGLSLLAGGKLAYFYTLLAELVELMLDRLVEFVSLLHQVDEGALRLRVHHVDVAHKLAQFAQLTLHSLVDWPSALLVGLLTLCLLRCHLRLLDIILKVVEAELELGKEVRVDGHGECWTLLKFEKGVETLEQELKSVLIQMWSFRRDLGAITPLWAR